MGIMSAHQPSHSGDYSPSQFIHVQSELISLSSQPSLPSVPSLTSQTQQQQLYLPSTTTTTIASPLSKATRPTYLPLPLLEISCLVDLLTKKSDCGSKT
ncbi:hypothetical protein CK203_076626 [Vitis vinifera]|uniref:Uncharacterized protein n=1 Tax=Vitis vinifera TaxID=29760 RepID=A0A438EZG9_VITVI|nr:hypothetical protein CK203_076626 [Vitis vinifera]